MNISNSLLASQLNINSISKNETSKLETAKQFDEIYQKAVTEEDQKKLKESAQEFETYFINQILQEMRKSMPKSELFDESSTSEIYEDMIYEDMAKEISKAGGLGMADMLYKQMEKESDKLYKPKTDISL